MALPQRLRQIASVLGVLCAAFGALALVGWLRDVNPFAFLRLNAMPMKPGASLCLILRGLSLWLQLQPGKIARHVGTAFAAVALVFTLAALARKVFNVDVGLDRIF